MAMPDEDSDKGILLFGSLAFFGAERLHPLSLLNDLIRPSTPSNPRSFRAELPLTRLPAPPL